MTRIPVPPPARAHGDRRLKRLRTRADDERYALDVELEDADDTPDDLCAGCGQPIPPMSPLAITRYGETFCTAPCATWGDVPF